MKIGERDVVHTASLIVPKGENAIVDFRVGQWDISLKIIFVRNDDKAEKGSISLEVIDGNPQISLINWNNSLGTATIQPAVLGTANDGRKLSFMLCHWLIGDTNKVDIQFLLGGEQ